MTASAATTTLPTVPVSGQVMAIMSALTAATQSTRFGATRILRDVHVGQQTGTTVAIDDEPAVLGKAEPVALFYRLGVAKFGLPAGAKLLHVMYVCNCEGNVDQACGHAGCWGMAAGR